MANEQGKPVAELIRAEIARHQRSVMVAASGMGQVLYLLDRYLVETEKRLARLERAEGKGNG